MKRRFYVTGEPRNVKKRQDIAPTSTNSQFSILNSQFSIINKSYAHY
jgi:hypothetical protein